MNIDILVSQFFIRIIEDTALHIFTNQTNTPKSSRLMKAEARRQKDWRSNCD